MRIDRIKLATQLAKKDLTIQELARRATLSRATVSSVKCGKTCSPDTASKLCSALNVPVEDLLEQEAVT